ncbi:hypothetical protein E2C01_015962 [Portunus trituberculatus]|uniref:Uncharacterized protein n=1 Tax=Portunus trituberculatus TaxID=210409 RepID=A0A5B7DMU4_PORTR|nr:hypothetical protein [Portunus trituberculatus]
MAGAKSSSIHPAAPHSLPASPAAHTLAPSHALPGGTRSSLLTPRCTCSEALCSPQIRPTVREERRATVRPV